MERKERTIGVRVDSAFSAEIKAEADRLYGGNESLLIREATRVYLRLRKRLGFQFDGTLALWLGDEAVEEKAA